MVKTPIMKKLLFLLFLILDSLILNAQPFKKLGEFKEYLQKNATTVNKIEGIWEMNKTIDSGVITTMPPYQVAIIKVGENIFKTFAINEITGTINEDTECANSYIFELKNRKGRYDVELSSTCSFSYHDKAFINAQGELTFSGKIEQNLNSFSESPVSNVFDGKYNLVDGLQGKVSGVQIANTGGQAGSGSSVVIRGYNSFLGSNQPLYIVDGVPIDNTSDRGTANKNSVGYTNRAIDINPDNIESVTVLKGGAASALYGIQASNGAIIITTKMAKAKKGFSYNIISWNQFNVKAKKL
jgi:TonB-dependent SusC/RagA subfamily outer membrane receptor